MNKELFKNVNPIGYSLLKSVYSKNAEVDKEYVTADSDFIGLFECAEHKHEFILPINQYTDIINNEGCPICKDMINSKGELPIKLKQRVRDINAKGRYEETLWFYPKRRFIVWRKDLYNDFVHIEESINSSDSGYHYAPLSTTHNDIAKEYSANNLYPLNWISYTGWYDFDEPLKWKCSKCNYEYDMLFKRKVMFGDKACPYCNGILPTYEHSLAYLYPEIAEEWDKREQALKISSKEIFGDKIGTRRAHGVETLGLFQCKKCGVIYHRKIEDIINDRACVFCENGNTWEWTEKVFREKGIYCQDEYYCEYNLSVKVSTFKCEECGNVFDANLKDRLIRKYVCLGCANKKAVAKYNSLTVTHPELAKEWSSNNPKSTDEILKSLYAYALWICPICKGEYNYRINQREVGDNVCPYCNNQKLLSGYNSLDITHPNLAKQWSNNNLKKSNDVMKKFTIDALWICPICNGEYSYQINRREENDNVCPYCNNKKLLPGYNSLDVTHPVLAKEWSTNNVKKSNEVMKNSPMEALWICSICDGEYHYPINRREEGDNVCPYCNNKRALAGFNSFKFNHPELMSEWDYTNNYLLCNPDNILDNYNKNVWWICNDCGHRYLMSPKRRLLLQKRKIKVCPYEKGYRRKKQYYYQF